MAGRRRWGSGAAAAASGAAWLAGKGFDGRRPIAALAPGAAHFTKRWPQEYWEMLTRSLVAQGYDVAVLTGGDFRDEGATIAAAGGVNAASTAGALGLQETAAVLRASRVVVSGDTGLMHLATAVGTRVVALFGPTVRQFGFFPYRSPARRCWRWRSRAGRAVRREGRPVRWGITVSEGDRAGASGEGGGQWRNRDCASGNGNGVRRNGDRGERRESTGRGKGDADDRYRLR